MHPSEERLGLCSRRFGPEVERGSLVRRSFSHGDRRFESTPSTSEMVWGRRRGDCRSASNRDPAEVGSINLMLLRKSRYYGANATIPGIATLRHKSHNDGGWCVE